MSLLKLYQRALPHISKRCQSTALKPLAEVPGPKSLPLIGNFLNFKTEEGSLDPSQILKILQYQWDQHGDIIHINAPFREPVIFVFNPDMAEKIYRAAGTMPNRPGFDALKYIRSQDELTQKAKGLLSSQGDDWYQFRSKVQQPMMRPKSALRYAHDIDDIAEEFIREKVLTGRNAKSQVGEKFIDDLYKWALESVTYLACNTRIGCLKNDLAANSEQMVIIRAVSNIFKTTMYLDNGLQMWRFFPSPKLNKFQEGYNIFKQACFNHIYKALQEIKNRPEGKESHPTLLEMFMARGCDEETAVVMALDMMFAGVDTSSHLTAYVLYRLAKNPEVQERLYQDLLKELPDESSKLEESSMERLPFLKAVLKETLRLHPPAPINARILNEPIELSGYEIPAGVVCAIAHYHMSNSDRFVPNAKEFRPERWLKNHKDYIKVHPFVFLPFGHGPRMCIGRRFAELETSILVAKMIRRFQVEWHNPDLVMKTETITKPASPLKFTFIDR